MFEVASSHIQWRWDISASSRVPRATATKKIENLAPPTSEGGFCSQMALAQYIGVKCRPEPCASVRLITTESTKVEDAQFKWLVKAIRHLKEISLHFDKLYISSVGVAFVTCVICERGMEKDSTVICNTVNGQTEASNDCPLWPHCVPQVIIINNGRGYAPASSYIRY